jgi:hypothetical protein
MTQSTSTLPYSISELNMSEVGNYNTLRVTVEGFWSDVVNISIRRIGYDYKKPSEWVFSVSHSSGGFSEDYDNLQATINFGLANIAAAEYCRELEKRVNEIEEAYVRNIAAAIAAADEQNRIREEKLKTDPEIGDVIAKANIKQMMAEFAENKSPVITVSYRANPDSTTVTIKPFYQRNGSLRFSVNGSTFTRKEATDFLSSMSRASLTYSTTV